jgi:hypothetical protein
LWALKQLFDTVAVERIEKGASGDALGN